MNFGTYIKQPSEVLDYDLDYSEWLTSGDNVQSAQVAVTPTGLTVESTFINDPRVKIWLSGQHLQGYGDHDHSGWSGP